MADSKTDRINEAYSLMRVSGITLQPSSDDNDLALARMEAMANEFYARGICTGYYKEDSPDLNSPSGLEPALWFPFSCVLAFRLLSDFGKGSQEKIDPVLIKNSNAGLSFLYSYTSNPQQTQYPTRQPVGAGNSLRNNRFQRYYQKIAVAPNDCSTNVMQVDDVNDFIEHFDSFLISPEEIASYVLTADTGLTIQSQSFTSPDVFYRVKAVGNNGTKPDSSLQVKIVMTTDDGRIETRVTNFNILPEETIS